MMKRVRSVLALGGVMAGGVVGCAASQEGFGASAAPTGDVHAGVGDLDNDKDLDLIVVHRVKRVLAFYEDGSKNASHEQANLSGPAHVALVDVTNPAHDGVDGFLDVIVLEQDKATGKGGLHVWVNLGETNGDWNGVKKIGTTYSLDHPFDLAWGGGFANSSGRGLVLYDARTRVYRGARSKGNAGGSFLGFSFDSDRAVAAGETIESVSDHGANGLAFLMLDASGQSVVRRYEYGQDLQ